MSSPSRSGVVIGAGAGASFDFVRKPYDAGALDRAIAAAMNRVETAAA